MANLERTRYGKRNSYKTLAKGKLNLSYNYVGNILSIGIKDVEKENTFYFGYRLEISEDRTKDKAYSAICYCHLRKAGMKSLRPGKMKFVKIFVEG